MTKSRLSRTLLAGTVLTAAPVTALHAATITESADFSGNQSLPFNLPVGTTVVNGTIGGGDVDDYFLFQGLGAGTFTLTLTSDTLCGAAIAYTSSGTQLGSFGGSCESVLSPELVATGAVPGDGKLLVRLVNEEGAAAYSVSLDAPLAETVPEPSTFAAGLLAGGGAMLWRRRRAKSN